MNIKKIIGVLMLLALGMAAVDAVIEAHHLEKEFVLIREGKLLMTAQELREAVRAQVALLAGLAATVLVLMMGTADDCYHAIRYEMSGHSWPRIKMIGAAIIDPWHLAPGLFVVVVGDRVFQLVDALSINDSVLLVWGIACCVLSAAFFLASLRKWARMIVLWRVR